MLCAASTECYGLENKKIARLRQYRLISVKIYAVLELNFDYLTSI